MLRADLYYRLFCSVRKKGMMGFASLYPSYTGLWLAGKLGLHKVFVEGMRYADSQPLHHDKRDAIDERIIFVLRFLKIKPALVEKVFIDVNPVHGRAVEKPISNLDHVVLRVEPVRAQA
jgi:hypothetical protein